MYIIVAIIAFGLLIAVHEVGHFTAAKLLGVRVNEFAIGMGPKILWRKGKETLYSLRVFPFGGYCAMDEDTASDDPRAFTAQKRWRRVVILAAGGAANFLAAFIIILILVAGMKGFAGTTITRLEETFPNNGENGLMVGDTIVSINGEKLYYIDDFPFLMQLSQSNYVDVSVRRNGGIVNLNGYLLERREYIIDGEPEFRYGITFNGIEPNFVERIKFSCYMTMNNVRLVRLSVAQLISGAAGVRDLAGPVAIVDAMNDIGREAPSVGAALSSIASFTAFIAVNIAIVNFLPIPAMDGGRIMFVILSWIIERVTRRRLDPKYEGYIHAATLVVLLGLMAFILVNDVIRIIGR